jgi:hypothetical protein
MTAERIAIQVVSLLLTALAAWLLPLWGMRALMPALDRSAPRVRNYRGVEVPVGLGIVWLMWAAGLFVAGAVEHAALWGLNAAHAGAAELRAVSLESLWPLRSSAMLLLVLAAFGFGLVDDVFGDGTVKGFRGHLDALRHGRLTTGMLKMLGIGAASAWVASGLAVTEVAPTSFAVAEWIGRWLLLILVIALTANLLNLLDLRPGRALKGYLVVCVPAAVATAAIGVVQMLRLERAGAGLPLPWLEHAGGFLALLFIVVGPALAVWRFDVSERGILGDAGANAAGALAGYLFAAALNTWGLIAAAVVLLAVNLASERVSFSRLVDENAMLGWLDGLGRVRHAETGGGESPGRREGVGGDGTTGAVTSEKGDDTPCNGSDAYDADIGDGTNGSDPKGTKVGDA